jgi:hypothetical protein
MPRVIAAIDKAYRRFRFELTCVGVWFPFNYWSPRMEKEKVIELKLLFAVAHFLSKFGFSSTNLGRLGRRRIKALNKSWVPPFDLESTHPNVEVLIMCVGKDMSILEACIGGLARFSKNPITEVTIVTTENDYESLSALAKEFQFDFKISIRSEAEFLSESERSLIGRFFNKKQGWITQQYLTTKFVYESLSDGVLTINADTVLLAPTVFLSGNGSQILHVSSEFSPSYYRFLNSIGLSQISPDTTHITHHMLMQPELMRRIFHNVGLGAPRELLRKASLFSKNSGEDHLCLEFEPYAQGILKFFPERVELVKFSNIGLPRTLGKLGVGEIVRKLELSKTLKSVSFHGYLN